ncbi:MAG: class I SAM-dependent methyltransferase [Candidatus Bathyarchaeia archaeon]
MDRRRYLLFEDHVKEYDSWYIEHAKVFECEARALEALDLRGFGLDVGVGTGVFACRVGVSVGVDPSLSMLRIVKARGVEVVSAVGEHIPFREDAFDYILLVNTLCFLDSPRIVIKESVRVLKKNGSLILCEVPKDSSWGSFYEREGRRGHKFYSQACFYTSAEIRHLLESEHLSIVKVKATLSYGPLEKEKIEDPKDDAEGLGFVCFQAVRSR